MNDPDQRDKEDFQRVARRFPKQAALLKRIKALQLKPEAVVGSDWKRDQLLLELLLSEL